MIVQLASAFLGSLGFALILKIKGRQVLYAGIGGLVTWFIYLMVFAELQSDFIANLIAAVYVAIYAELMARVNKAPATIFLTAAAVPLIPGGRLYYTMFGLVSEDDAMFVENGTAAIIIALAISLGFVFVAVVNKYVNRFLYGKRQKRLAAKAKENTN
ncbi:MAG: threonine/serine exporter family protein [Emergencia timonensis]|uniref:threonine/serine exporter family protein n=1 Tax=Emergencia timonensis TaxID=1776384 RepID=UPI0008299A3D|nr:threonine/serine exporter family protein [Emergencia timonensis]WNX86922.1 threonine/serine exporter family protein [Emergencia timonensis]